MAAFRDDPSEWERLDWRLLQNGAVVLYHRPEILAADLDWLAGQGYEVRRLDAARWATPADFHGAAAGGLGLGDSYGRTLDALTDALSDLPVPEHGGAVVTFEHYDRFVARHPMFAHGVLDVLERAARRLLLTGRRLLALVQSDDPELRLPPVGANAVAWNPREWTASSRRSNARH